MGVTVSLEVWEASAGAWGEAATEDCLVAFGEGMVATEEAYGGSEICTE